MLLGWARSEPVSGDASSDCQNMLKTGLSILSVLMILAGLTWAAQGSGYFPYPASSFMIDQSVWIFRGGVVALLGLALLVYARRR